MLRHDVSRLPSKIQSHNSRTSNPQHETHIFAFIVEIYRVAEFQVHTPAETPIIALCDSASATNSVSAQLVQDLENLTQFTLPSTGQVWRREATRIHIRWSCAKLGLLEEESTFFIEPKAQFKMIFGCGHLSRHTTIKNPRHLSTYSYYGKEKNVPLSERAAGCLHQGIENGTLIPLKVMPPTSGDDETYKSIAELEKDLEYVWRSYSNTEHSLASDSIHDGSSSYLDNLPGVNMLYSEPESNLLFTPESRDTSISDGDMLSDGLSRHLKQDWDVSQQRSHLGSWIHQSFSDDPPWISSMFHPANGRMFFKRCLNLNKDQQKLLTATRRAAEKTAEEYWTWDDDEQNYKHYDEGSSEPVWYNPP